MAEEALAAERASESKEEAAPDIHGIDWLSNRKVVIGVSLIVVSFVLGLFGKILPLVKLGDPVYVYAGIITWIVSWAILFLGALFIGRGAMNLLQQRVKFHAKRSMKEAYNYTRDLHRKSMERLKSKRQLK